MPQTQIFPIQKPDRYKSDHLQSDIQETVNEHEFDEFSQFLALLKLDFDLKIRRMIEARRMLGHLLLF